MSDPKPVTECALYRELLTPAKIDELQLALGEMGVHVPARDTAFFHAIVKRWLGWNGR